MISIIMFSDHIGADEKKFCSIEPDIYQEAFLNNYNKNNNFAKCEWCIVKCTGNYAVYRNGTEFDVFNDKYDLYIWLNSQCEDSTIFFFNNFAWIDNIRYMRKIFKNVKFVIRSDGNDIYKTMLSMPQILLKDKISEISNIINNFVDKLIIDSDYSYFKNLSIGINPRKMVKIRGGIDYCQANKNIFQKLNNRRLFDDKHSTHGKKIFVIVCGLLPFERILEFLEQFVKLSYDNSWHLVLIGDGSLRESIISYLENFFSKSSCSYFGHLTHRETMNIISIADLFISLSIKIKANVDNDTFIYTETMDKTIMEAVSQNVPVLALESGEIPEVFYENKFIGYCAENVSDIVFYLEKFMREDWTISDKAVDYSWENVFSRYDLLFRSFWSKSGVSDILILDIDGTLIDEHTNLKYLDNNMKKNKSNKIYIGNTARNEAEAKYIFDTLPFDYMIYENGMRIMSRCSNIDMWNILSDEFTKNGEFLEFFHAIKSAIDQPCELTHSGVINIKITDVTDVKKIKKIVNEICGNKIRDIICSDKNLKVVNKSYNKRMAMEYILKNHVFFNTAGAGNGIGDIDFVSSCDLKFLREDIVKYTNCKEKKNIFTFKLEDTGIKLIKLMISKLKRIGTPYHSKKLVFNEIFYSGKDEKYGVTVGNKNYILKISSGGKNGDIRIMSELVTYVLCKELGICCQKVKLIKNHGKINSLIEDFKLDDTWCFVPYIGIFEARSDILNYDLSYSYENILKIFCKDKRAIFSERSLKHFWNTYIIDYLIASNSRNGTNWGFFKIHDIFYPVPIFDTSSSFYNENYGEAEFELKQPVTRVTFGGEALDRFTVIRSGKYKLCNQIVKNIVETLSISDISRKLYDFAGDMDWNWFLNILEKNFEKLKMVVKSR